MDFNALQIDIATRFPQQAASGTAGDAQAVAVGMNALTAPVVSSVPMPKVLIWAGLYGVTAKIQARALAGGDPLQSAALSLLLALQGGYPLLDITDTHVLQMMANFVAAGDVSADAQTALVAMGTMAVSYVRQNYGVGQITAADVLTAWGQPTVILTPEPAKAGGQ